VNAYLGLGSNVGDRLANLRAALTLLDASDGVAVVARSSVYESEPVGEIRSQRDFYNAVVEVETELEPHDLLAVCKQVEQKLGRAPGGPIHGPRPIDVDVLLIEDLELVDQRLTVPHPQITKRRFVLAPLLELDPSLALPGGASLAQALVALGEDQRVDQVGGWS
jgi:2-amino-4-hydroxy-6-hydroxymethyldihydropteridine diphosphokinase